MKILTITPENSPLKELITDSASPVEWWLEEEAETDALPPSLTCTQCGVFVGHINFGIWKNAGSGDWPDWNAYCKECV